VAVVASNPSLPPNPFAYSLFRSLFSLLRSAATISPLLAKPPILPPSYFCRMNHFLFFSSSIAGP
jgi:hypothetical protein